MHVYQSDRVSCGDGEYIGAGDLVVALGLVASTAALALFTVLKPSNARDRLSSTALSAWMPGVRGGPKNAYSNISF